ncbi:MAG: ABC transporter ATP-binding protein [Candidatus Nanoarchaeia archaeon]
MNPIIRIEDVWKRYDMGKAGGLTVLKEISLSVNKGEFVAITGPSGSGKSTMVNMIGALDKPSWGSIYLDEKNIANMSESSLAFLRGKTIGFVFQQFNLIQDLTALQNVMLPMEIIDIPEHIARPKAIEILSKLGLGDRLHHKPSELSGGQQQRVAIARALANDPEVILADEPTGNLDSKIGQFVMDFLEELNKKEGKTVVIVTHDLNLVDYAKRVIYIKDGRIERESNNKGRMKK